MIYDNYSALQATNNSVTVIKFLVGITYALISANYNHFHRCVDVGAEICIKDELNNWTNKTLNCQLRQTRTLCWRLKGNNWNRLIILTYILF